MSLSRIRPSGRWITSVTGYTRRADDALESPHAVVLGPLKPVLKGYRRLIVSPDCLLNLVPYAAMRADDRYEIERRSVSYVASPDVSPGVAGGMCGGVYAMARPARCPDGGGASRQDLAETSVERWISSETAMVCAPRPSRPTGHTRRLRRMGRDRCDSASTWIGALEVGERLGEHVLERMHARQ